MTLNFCFLNLTIDIGNTFVKMALMEKGQIVDTFHMQGYEPDVLEAVFNEHPGIDKAILVCTRGGMEELENHVRERVRHYVRFDHTVPVPIENLYATPLTLGYDRLAAAVGAHTIYPNHPVLTVDFGTAITYDIVTAAGEFLGGNISPGAQSRFRALHDYTSTLPLRKLTGHAGFPGKSTDTAIENGVALGIVFETEGYIRTLGKEYDGIKIIFTGGDADYFAKRVKNPIFATSDLVFYGLNAILEYNNAN